jgi:hypothetical protein
MSFGVILTSIYPPRFFNSCVFSSKISNYSIFRFNFLKSSFDNLGFVIKDYGSLLNCYSHVTTKFSLVIDDAGTHYTGSLCGTDFEKGLIFDSSLNYYTYSASFHYQGYIRNIEKDVTYYGGLRNKLPNGTGMILIASRPAFIGNFLNGAPSGIGFFFGKREELEFFGIFHSKPMYGVYSKNFQYYEGIFSALHERDNRVDFEKYPVTLYNLPECIKLHQEFQDFIVKGICRHFNERIFEIRGELVYGSKRLTGRFIVKYRNGGFYRGMLEEGSRIGLGYFESPEGSFKLFGVFNGESAIQGYLLIHHSSENSAKSQKIDNILIPQMIFGNILYDSNGKIHVKGSAKVIFTNGYIYYGQFCNNSITGYGRLYKKDTENSVYTGQLFYGKQFGLGQLKTKSFTYEGEISNDQFHGYGKLQKDGIIAKGYWQNGLCHYAQLIFQNSQRSLGFNMMSILFENPSVEFRLESLIGTVELYFNKSTGQTLAEVYDEINNPDRGDKKPETRALERRGSLDQSQLPKPYSVPAKRKLSVNHKENSSSSLASRGIKTSENHKQYPPRVNTSLRRLESHTSIHNAPNRGDTTSNKQKTYKISNFTFQKSYTKQLSKFYVSPSRVNLSLNTSAMVEMEENVEKIYSFVGRCTKDSGGKFLGEVRKHGDVFCILETDKWFQVGTGYYKNCDGSEEIFGEMSNFKISGLGTSMTATKRFTGEFRNNKPEGVVIKSRPPKEDYIGTFRAGLKHGFGIKTSVDEIGDQVTFLFNFWKGELRYLAKIGQDDTKSPHKTSNLG